MPQKPRSIHPEDAQDERLAALPLTAAYTYAYLASALDDEGRAKDKPATLNGLLWPLRADEHPTAVMEADLAALDEAGLIHRYAVDGRPYLHDPRWKARHKQLRSAASTLPPCPDHDKSFDEAVTETLGRFAEQVNTAVGTAAGHLDQKRLQDSVARLVEDVTYLVDPEKAVANGQKVRNLLRRSKNPDAGSADAPAADSGAAATDDSV
jgi:hypothetical protein